MIKTWKPGTFGFKIEFAGMYIENAHRKFIDYSYNKDNSTKMVHYPGNNFLKTLEEIQIFKCSY